MSESSSLRADESDEESAESFQSEKDSLDFIDARAITRLLDEKTSVPCVLTLSDASKCLYGLGKCDDGTKYAYLAINVSNRSLTDVSVILNFRFLLRVNVSGNRLTREALKVLTSMPCLLMLEADENDLLSADFEPMAQLQVLCLNKNRLRDISYISHPLVETLDLSYNRVDSIDLNPYILTNLKSLQMRGNIITKVGAMNFSVLERLYLAENEIEELVGFDNLVSLKILHLRDNQLRTLDGFTSNCARLKYLNIRKNSITLMSEIKKLACLPALEILVVSENPVITDDENEEENEQDNNYRVTILAMLPGLERLNKDIITNEERREAEFLARHWRAERR